MQPEMSKLQTPLTGGLGDKPASLYLFRNPRNSNARLDRETRIILWGKAKYKVVAVYRTRSNVLSFRPGYDRRRLGL
jgi:hypothetical protein